MSAFMLSNESLCRLARSICCAPGCLHVEGYDERTEEKLAAEMFALNRKALVERYGDDESPEVFEWEGCSMITGVPLVKSLSCFLYQCAEGDIPKKSKLFKKLERYKNQLASQILLATPEGRAAEWA